MYYVTVVEFSHHVSVVVCFMHIVIIMLTVMVATSRISAAAQIDPSYSPGCANVSPIQYMIAWAHASLPPNGIEINSAVFIRLTRS